MTDDKRSPNVPEAETPRLKRQKIVWTLTRFLAAFVLLFAAWEKARQLSSGTYAISASILDSPLINFLAVLVESAFGTWLLAGLAPRLTRLATLTLFALFAAISLSKGLSGHESCGCFGARQVNPFVTFSLDFVIAAASFFSKSSKSETLEFLFNKKQLRKEISVLFLCICVSSFYGSSIFIFQKESDDVLETTGQTFEPGSTITVEPDRWLDKECPLFDFCEHGDELKQGRRIVMLRRVGCKECLAALPELRKAADSRGVTLTLVDVENSEESEPAEQGELLDALDPNYQWFVQTPCAFVTDAGVVVEIIM